MKNSESIESVFIKRVADTVGYTELALALNITKEELINKLTGVVGVLESEIRITYQFLVQITAWSKAYV